MNRRKLYISLLMGTFMLGCASAPPVREQVGQEVQRVVQSFEQAVKARDADAVYALMSDNWKIQYDRASFKDYFYANYDAFVEYSERLVSDPSVVTIRAQFEGDPCGFVSWQTDAEGGWKLASIPRAVKSVDERKAEVAQLVRSRGFMEGLEAYAAVHPEWSGERLRHVKRVMMFEEIGVENIEFSAQEAVITVPQTAIVRLSCGQEGWSIIQCYSVH